MNQRGAIAIGLAVAAGLVGYVDGAWAQMSIQRVSVSSAGDQGNGGSYNAALSSNGRYVAFYSNATNLVADDTNTLSDIFVHDLVTGATERVNLNSSGEEATGGQSGVPSLSWDGRYVVFESDATNLVAGDTNTSKDIFVRDRIAGSTERINVSSEEIQANNYSYSPSISGDGRYVAFYSYAANLAVGDVDGVGDIFIRDRTSGTTELISIATDELTKGNNSSYDPSVSGDGRYVAFSSDATNLVAGDSNLSTDIFVRDRTAGTTELASVSSEEVQGNSSSRDPRISLDGRYIVFVSEADNLVTDDTNIASDVFVRDLQAGTTERVSIGDGEEEGDTTNTWGYGGGISSDGRYVVFSSDSTNLVANDTNSLSDIFRRDRTAGETVRVNLSSTGAQTTDGFSYGSPAISGNGMVMAFVNGSTTLVPNDTNSADDVFVVTFPSPQFPWIMFNPVLTGKGEK
ncbi:MAG: TolB family protein [Desulfobulbaceae bacterium]